MNQEFLDRVTEWIAGDPDIEDRETLELLVRDGAEAELERRFEAPLRFGTAGLRGPVMAGPAGMNRYTVRRATQGVVAWLGELGADLDRGVVVGRDARHGSEAFNDEAVAVLLGAGVRVHEMPGPLPTPYVAYAVKALGAAAGIMITASHNPPGDNGYKLYAHDGAQIIAPHDAIVERYAATAGTPELGDRSSALHQVVGPELFDAYREHFVGRFGVGASDLAVTYTPLHGVGGASMLSLFVAAGFSRVTPVAAQFEPDPRFPTLDFPNPEEPGALELAMRRAEQASSSLVIANDPDADRLGVAVRGPQGWRVLRGDEIGWLLASALWDSVVASDDTVATTLVSSTMLEAMARERHVRYVTTLTGFKWLSRAAGAGTLRFAYEEALGYAVDPAVADKDGLSAALALCRLAHELAREGATLADRLDEIEAHFGVHAGAQLALRAQGPNAHDDIAGALERLRANPPSRLGPLEVTGVEDLAGGWHGLEPTEGLYVSLGEHARVVVRPSGTEAKLKAYLEVRGEPVERDDLALERERAGAVLNAVRDDLAQLLAL